MNPIYLDYNATTPLDSAVWEAMRPYWEETYGNPSSIHRIGRRARAALDDARDRISKVWRCQPAEIVFTSGGTESNNLAILGAARRWRGRGRHLITSAVEHHSVLHCFQYLERCEGFNVTYLPVDGQGLVDPGSLAAAVRPDTTLVSIMAANNEVGTIQAIDQLGVLCSEHGLIFHTDATQWFGKEPVASVGQFNASLVSMCAHKLHGPKGIGALFVRAGTGVDSLLLGGGHEHEHRAGTENLPGIIGLAEVCERFLAEPVFPRADLTAKVEALRNHLKGYTGVTIQGSLERNLANTIAFTVKNSDNLTLVAGFDLAGVCVSSGSACTAGSIQASHVLLAMGVKQAEANALVRFSLGRETSWEEVEIVKNAIDAVLGRQGAGQ